MHHTFLYIALLFMHDYDVKLSICTFYGGGKQVKAKFSFSFWTWIWFREIKLQEGLTKWMLVVSPTLRSIRLQDLSCFAHTSKVDQLR